MAPVGHIKLGPYNGIRPYILENPRDLRRDGANPYAAPSGGNQGYNDLSGWAEWTMMDWTAGAGMKDPEAGGFLFSTAETRVPGQVILPQHTWLSSSNGTWAIENYGEVFRDMRIDGYVTLGTSSDDYEKMTWVVLHPDYLGVGWGGGALPVAASPVFLYVKGAVGTVITVKVYESDGGFDPYGSVISTGTVTLKNATKAHRWEKVVLGASTATNWDDIPGTSFIILEISASASISIGTSTNLGAYVESEGYNDASWGVSVTNPPAIVGGPFQNEGGSSSGNITHIREFNGTVYAVGGTYLYKWDNTNDYWDVVTAALPATATDLIEFNGNLYIGRASGNFRVCSSADAITDGGSVGARFAKANGLLYKTQANDIYYSADGSTWTAVADVVPGTLSVLCMAGIGQNLYFATLEGLYYLAPGDFTVGVMPWHTQGSNTIVRMQEFQGDIYVVSNNTLFKMDAGGSILPLRMPDDDPNLEGYGRTIYSLHAGRNFLYVGTYGDYGGMVWSWSPEGWHTIAIMPDIPYSLCYSRVHTEMWVGSTKNIWAFNQTDSTINPYRDSTSVFTPHAWLETDKFYGGVQRLDKDFDSVFVSGENIASGRPIAVYWKYENDTDWVLLGSLSSGESTELRWNTGATREASKNIRLAFLLSTTSQASTPVLRVASLKYVPMVNDRYKWNLTIKVPAQMFDSDDEDYTGTYNQASMIAHLDACIQNVIPIILEDVDGTQYEVKITSHSRGVDKWTIKRDGTKEIQYTYFLGVEQIANNTYVA